MKEFVQNSDVYSVTADEAAESFLKAARDNVVVNKQECKSIASSSDVLSRLEKEFYFRCKNERVTVKAFYESKSNFPDEQFLLAKHMEKFDKLYAAKVTFHGEDRPCYTLEDTLEMYMEEHPPPKGRNCLKDIVDAGYGHVLAILVVWLFRRKEKKKNLMWIRGPPSTGKTDFLKRLRDIFCCVNFNFKQNYVVVSNPTKDQSPQIVLSMEFDVRQAFTESNFNNMLTMFEGDGAKVRNNLYQ